MAGYNEVYVWNSETSAWEKIGMLSGAKGDQGDSATITVGTVTEGNTVNVENVGTSSEAILNFTLKKGDKGDQGNAATVSVGTVQSGDYPSVTNSGSSTNAVLNFVIPKGDKGDKGNPATVNGKSGVNITLYSTDIMVDADTDESIKQYIDANGSGSLVRVTFAEDFKGMNATFTLGGKTQTKKVPSTSPYVVGYYTTELGSATITVDEYSKSVNITTYSLYEVSIGIAPSFDYQAWLTSGGVTQTYSSLAEVLADEKTVRQLMTKHDSVDYLVDCCENELIEDIGTIIANDICAKWINLRDYALDTLYGNTYIKAKMDEVDKYGYGEWVLVNKSLIPTMTSNTTPSGTVSNNSSNSNAYKAFTDEGFSDFYSNSHDEYVIYTFPSSKNIDNISLDFKTGNSTVSHKFKIYAKRNDSWVDVSGVEYENKSTDYKSYSIDCNLSGVTDIKFQMTYGQASITTAYIKNFRACFGKEGCPKGNVPIMTSNSAPYGEASDYKVFDGNTSTSSTGTDFSYKFANRICVRKFDCDVSGGVLQYSNDGSEWSNITGTNVNYYQYYRVHFSSSKTVKEIQFYGRELTEQLKTPYMTSNTSSIGQVSESGNNWKAYSNELSWTPSGWISSAGTQGQETNVNYNQEVDYVTFDFGKLVTPISFDYLSAKGWHTDTSMSVPTSINFKNFKLLASTDGSTWDTILEVQSANTQRSDMNPQPVNVACNSVLKKYRYVRFVPISGSTWSWPVSGCGINYLKIYCSETDYIDYDSRHYIYDNEVEVETVTKTSTSVLATIDTTNYSSLRAKVGKYATTSDRIKCGSSNATLNCLPNGYLDVSSVNGENETGFSSVVNTTDIVCWLE